MLHEHAEITLAGMQQLEQRDRDVLQVAWQAVRTDPVRAQRLWPELDGPVFGTVAPAPALRISFAPFPALAADHSCGIEGLERSLLRHDPDVVRNVLQEASALRDRFGEPGLSVTDRIEAWQGHHLRLRQLDDDYLRRADGTAAHFQVLSRLGETLPAHLQRAFSEPVNGLALYTNYHVRALAEMHAVHAACGSAQAQCMAQHSQALWRAFLLEAFALHFLQDAFAAGHMVGQEGDNAEAMGTHDYYSRVGVVAQLWSGDTQYHAHGDGFMTLEDRTRAGEAVMRSLRQLARALETGAELDGAIALEHFPGQNDLDVCEAVRSPLGLSVLAESPVLHEVLDVVPKPQPQQPLLRRMRKQLGFFMAATAQGSVVTHPAELGDSPRGGADRWSIGFQARLGVGLDVAGITTRTMDSYMSLEGVFAGQLSPAGHPGSVGFGGAVHIPWLFVPGDGLLWLPLAASDVLVNPALMALRGGPFGLARPVVLTDQLTFQFSFLRRATFLWYPDVEMTLQREGDTQSVDEVHSRYQLSLPVVTITFGRAFAHMLGKAFRAELALDLSHVPDVETTLGIGLLISTTTHHFL